MSRIAGGDVTADSLGDEDFIRLSRQLLAEMVDCRGLPSAVSDAEGRRGSLIDLDGAEWQAAWDLRQECRRARIYNSGSARSAVAAAINARAQRASATRLVG